MSRIACQTLESRIENLIDMAGNLTLCEAIGVLEVVKLNLYENQEYDEGYE